MTWKFGTVTFYILSEKEKKMGTGYYKHLSDTSACAGK